MLTVGGEAAAQKSAERLGLDVVPVFQDVRLRLDPAEPSYAGRVVIELEVRAPVRAFRFHSEGPTVRGLRLQRGGDSIRVTHAIVADDVIEVTAAAPLTPGRHTLSIEFENEFGTQAVGLYRVDHDGRAYAFTQFEADDARQAFPVWDEPGAKIPFVLTLTVPEDLMALANTPAASENVADGWRTTVFRRTKPLPAYLLAIAVGPFETLPVPGLPYARVVTPPGQLPLTFLARESSAPIMAALEEWFGRPYPYEKLDLIAVPEFWPGAMENPGLITFADGTLLVDSDAATVGQRRWLMEVLAHEFAHQWFGNLVTMRWWDDLWLNEAFADWIGHKVANRLYPELGGEVAELQRAQRIFASDARPSTKPIRRAVQPGEQLMEGIGITYVKGKLVLSAFEHWVGEESFRRGVNDYLAAHEWGNAEASDLWRALDAATGHDVSGAMAGFLEQPGHPRIDFEIEGTQVSLRQSRFRNAGVETEDLLWRVPVVLRWSDGETIRTHRLLLEDEETSVTLAASGDVEWLVPNAGAGGCYRWSLPPDRLTGLAAVADRELSPIERVELLGNLGALLDAGAVGAVEYVEVLRRFAGDPEPAVVTAVLAGFGTVRRVFVTDDLEEEFACLVRATFGPTLDRIGIDARAGEDELTSSLRSSLLNWLGDYGRDPRVRAHARDLADAYVENPSAVDPAVAGISLSLAALDGDLELFDTYRERFEAAEVPAEKSRFLAALGAFRDPVLVERALAYALEGPLRPQEIGVIPRVLRDTERGRQRSFDWLTEHWDELSERVSPPSLARAPAFGGDCSAERLEAMLVFFEEPSRRVPGAERVIRNTESRVGDCLRQRAAEGPAVAAWLQGFATDGGPAGTSVTSPSSPRRP